MASWKYGALVLLIEGVKAELKEEVEENWAAKYELMLEIKGKGWGKNYSVTVTGRTLERELTNGRSWVTKAEQRWYWTLLNSVIHFSQEKVTLHFTPNM
jgi:hypothetical protein